jgi:hypothetical protein
MYEYMKLTAKGIQQQCKGHLQFKNHLCINNSKAAPTEERFSDNKIL